MVPVERHIPLSLRPLPPSTRHDDPIVHYGVIQRTAVRRMTGRVGFLLFCQDRLPTVALLSQFCELTWPHISTRHTNATTICAEMKRRNLSILGDTTGYIRSLSKLLAAHKPTRANPASSTTILHAASAMTTECATLLCLMWATASRLTSMLNLRMDDINDSKMVDDSLTALSVTFRTGKTILATGAYTTRAVVPHRVAIYLSQSMGSVIFTKPAEYYYAVMRPTLASLSIEIRSIRRGALQALGTSDFPPEDILLMSRHTTVQGLYRYLDDGRHAHWETRKQQAMSTAIWKNSFGSTTANPTL